MDQTWNPSRASLLTSDPIRNISSRRRSYSGGTRRFALLLYYCRFLAKRLEEVGVAAVMLLRCPIGSDRGLERARANQGKIISQATIPVPVIVDTGISAQSHAAEAIEMGADSVSQYCRCRGGKPCANSRCFNFIAEAARGAFEVRAYQGDREVDAIASSPLDGFVIRALQGGAKFLIANKPA